MLILRTVLLSAPLWALPVLTPEQVAGLRGVGSPAISPDGRQVAYVLSIPDVAANRTRAEVWLGERKIADGGAPAWSPDGRQIAFLAAGQVSLWDSGTGTLRSLTRHAQPVMQFAWSPDGSKLALLSRDPQRPADSPVEVDRNNLRMYRLWSFDIATGAEKLLTEGAMSAGGYDQWFPDTFAWSPDSRTIAFSQRPHAKPGGHLFGDIALASLSGGVRKRTDAQGMEGFPQFSPDGKQLAWIANHRNHWVLTSDLMLAPAERGDARNMTASFDESVKEFAFTSANRIVFSAGDRTDMRLYSLDLSTGELRALTPAGSEVTQPSFDASGGSYAFVWQTSTAGPDVYVTSVAGFRPERISKANPHTEAWQVAKAEVMRWKSFDGMEIEGIVHKPAGAAKRLPLLVIPHGGPHGVMTNGYPSREALLFLSRGWVVFRPNFRGSGSYGERFLRANLGGWGVGDYGDVMSGVDALIEAGVADPDRMAIAGSSYGGYMTAWTIGQTNRFRAAVVGCAITDVPSFIRTTDVPERFEDYLGRDPTVYPRHSPMAFGERMKTPSLIWHGDLDERVPLMQSRHLYTQLLKNEVAVDFVIYPGEAHGLRRPGFVADLLARELAWLERHVTGGK